MNRHSPASAAVIAVASVVSCLPTKVTLEGKACSSAHPCPAGLPCNPYSMTCTANPGCPYDPPPNATCQGRDIYLSPTGSDACVGDSASCPRKTMPNPLGPADRVHLLGGTYGGDLSLSGLGTADCPISLDGAADGSTVLQGALMMWGSHWRISGITVQSSGHYYEVIIEKPLEDIVFESVTFAGTCAGPHVGLNTCVSCAIVACRFPSISTAAINVQASSLDPVVRGNVISLADAGNAIDVYADDAIVEGNDFSGWVAGGNVLDFHMSSGCVARRNVFHDLTFAGSGVGVLTYGDTTVQSNTFIRMTNARSAADRVTTFQDNIVSGTTYGQTPGLSDGGYNLFDVGVKPYQGSAALPTDQVGAPLLQDNFVPMAGSPAVDNADPALPVPPGGGSRADIGAFELGATRLPDGRYCMPPP